MDSTNAPNAQQTPPGTHTATAAHHSLVATPGERCPSCGDPIAADQRYCLRCGLRCGEPRLPFMNAVTFMDAMRQPAAAPPAPPKKKQRRLSPNAALIAGVGTLLLAMGVGVLIGRSGDHTTASTQQQAPIVIKEGGGGGTAEAETTAPASKGSSSGTGKSKPNRKAATKAKAEAESGKGAEEVLKPSGNVNLPEATVEPGDKCKQGEAGCKGGEFTGEFFGE
jgi:hypothetical protein